MSARQPRLAAKLGFRLQMLITDQEAHELFGRHRGDLSAQAFQRQSMDAGQQPAVAPFEVVHPGEAATQHHALRFQRDQGDLHIGRKQSEVGCNSVNRGGANAFDAAANELSDGFLARPIGADAAWHD